MAGFANKHLDCFLDRYYGSVLTGEDISWGLLFIEKGCIMYLVK